MPIPNYAPQRRREIAAALQINEQYVYQIVKGLKIPSATLSRQFHKVAPDAQLQDLRPDDWHVIWPELAKTYTRADGRIVTDERKTERRTAKA